MFGYNRKSPDETGFLRLTDAGYEIIKDHELASGFETENLTGKKGWGSPEQWKEFFNSEEELKDWRFHVVLYNVKDQDDE